MVQLPAIKARGCRTDSSTVSWRARRLVLVALALVGVIVPVPGLSAEAAVGGTRPVPPEALGALSAGVAGVQAGGTRWVSAYDGWAEAGTELIAATDDQAAAAAEVADLTTLRVQVEARKAEAAAARAQAESDLEVAQQHLARVAVLSFVDAGTTSQTPDVTAIVDADRQRRVVLGETVANTAVLAVRQAKATRDESARIERQAAAELEDVTRRVRDAQRRHDDAATLVTRWTTTRSDRQVKLVAEAPGATVGSSDLEIIALDAYRRSVASSGCSLSWTVVAGVGRVESRHGHAGGASVAANGDVSPAIYGVPLDGSGGNLAITDTDGGLLDGDAELDRAVGPMQFIPSTWQRWATDGNGDRRADPQNLYDATAAAARYLCAGSGGDPSEEGVRAGVFSYNHSEAYVDRVLSYSASYASLGLG